MGKVIKKKLNGMSWWMKTSLVLLLTLATSVFMYQGWYMPNHAKAASKTYYIDDAGGSGTVIATGVSTTVVAATNPTSAVPTPDITLLGTASSATTSNRTTGTYTAGVTMLEAIYNTAYPANTAVTGTSFMFRLRDGSGGYTAGIQLFYVAANGTKTNFTGSVVNQAVASGGSLDFTVNLSGQTATVPAGSKLGVRIIYVSGASTDARFYFGSASSVAAADSGVLIVDEVAATGNLTFAEGTNPVSANISQASTGTALDGFTMAMSSGTSTVSSLTVTGSASFTATNIPTNGVKIYRDLGTVGTLDGADVLLNTTSPAISGNATTVPLTAVENVTTTAVNYLVVVNANAGATVGNNFTATISGAAGTGIGTPVDNDANSATLTVVAGNVVTVGEGTDPANNTNAQRGSSQAIDAFTLTSSTGTASVTAITVTGSANFTATNVGTNGVKIYRDLGTVGTLDGADVLLNTTSPAIAVNATTVPLTAAESVTTAANYLVVVDIAAAATLTNTITANVSGVTQTGAVSVTDSDAASATLTVTAAQTLTIGNGTNPASANIQTGNVASLDSFTMAINTGTGAISSLTLTGSANFTTANIASAAIYVDNGVVGTYEAGTDTLVASSYGQAGAVGTITFSVAEPVTTVAKNYLVRVTANGGATVGNAFTGTITGATGVGIVTASDTNSATLTIVAGPVSTITSCGGCHGYTTTYADGTARNTPAGQFQGDHNKHVIAYANACSVCHTVPATTTSADYGHASGTIQMTGTINGDTGAVYSKAATTPFSFATTNAAFTSGTCANTYCHSNGTSVISGTIPANTSLAWGTATSNCGSCHGSLADDGRPNYTNIAPKRNTHGDGVSYGVTHKAQACTVCHTGVTGTAGAYTISNTATHNNGAYDILGTLGYTQATGVCSTASCHGAVAWGGQLGCIECHAAAINSPVAAGLDAAVTQRRAITPDFAKTSSHKRNGAGAVTNEDCGVCHMEGTSVGGAINATYHKNGKVELRDPDSGLTIKGVTWSNTPAGAGSFAPTATDAAPVRFSRNLGALEGLTNNVGALAIQINHCLHCHDAGGATQATARVTGGVALKPFNTTVAANPGGGVLDVSSQFATTNRTYHPVLGKQNNSYTQGTRMAAPWNITKTNGNSTSWGNIMTCWDCHAPSGSTSATTLTATDVHGSTITAVTGAAPSVEARGIVWRNAALSAAGGKTTLCISCHLTYDNATGLNHATGSAFGTGGSSSMSLFICYQCTYCHASSPTKAARPLASGDVHGYNTQVGGAALATNFGYSFIRSAGFVGTYTWVPGNCTGYTSQTNGTTACSRTSMGTYTPGGTY